MNLSILNLILMVGALARLTRLITFDTILRQPRLWIADRSEWFGYLFQCPWCMSIWLAPVVFGSTWAWGNGEWLWWIWGGLSASYVVGLLADRVEN